MGHTLRGEHTGGIGKVINPKVESVWCAHCRGANIVKFKMTEVTTGRWLGSSEEVW
jgi:hypothetical protein